MYDILFIEYFIFLNLLIYLLGFSFLIWNFISF